MGSVRGGVLLVVLAQVAVLTVLAGTGCVGAQGVVVGAGYGAFADVLVIRGLAGATRIGVANAVTWLRCGLAGGVTALVVTGLLGPLPVPVFLGVAGVALLLDAVDGRIARRTGTVTAFGGRFDMEVDASLVLVLSVAAAVVIGPWVLLAGAARYLLLAATLVVPWLAAPTPPRRWRKAVAAGQGVALTVVAAGVLPSAVGEGIAIVAAAALACSFVTQVGWLARQARRPAPGTIPAGAHASRG